MDNKIASVGFDAIVVCDDCGKSTSDVNNMYGIRTLEGQYKMVCPSCAKKYGFNCD